MKKNLLFPGFTIFVTLGLLLSLAYPTSAQAQIPFEKTAGQDSLIVELVKPVAVGDMYTLDLGTATTLCIPAPGVLVSPATMFSLIKHRMARLPQPPPR